MLRRSDEILHDDGSVALAPHILLSSRRHFREARLEGSRSSRAYAALSDEWGRGNVVAHLIQVFNKPGQVIAPKIRHALRILLPVKYLTEFVVKVG